MVIWVAGTMFKDLGHTDGEITSVTASVGIMWSLKPLYAGLLDMLKTKKFWVLSMEFAMALLLGLMALSLSLPGYFMIVMGLLWLIAFASATQDICIDGIYITSLEKDRQAAWVGLQGAFWVTGRIFATSIVVLLAGALKTELGMAAKPAWALALCLSAAVMSGLGLYNYFMLPTGSIPPRPSGVREVATTFVEQFLDFLRKPKIWLMLLFVFLYRSGEGFLLVEAPLFMQAKLADGGLGLTLENKGLIDGLISTVVSLGGGLAGGAFIARYGLKRSLVFMALCMNVPHVCYVILSQLQTPDAPMSFYTIGVLVTLEKFGYSFGFVANMLYMMQQISPGKYHMTHYAFCTALMNLVLVPTQASSGWIADAIGYKNFFVFVMIASIPSVIAAWFAPFPNTPADNKESLAPEGRPEPAEAV
jgi:MFS transporter, PAT family, beta-lactamase induction signal transducer AmpG